MDDWYRLGQIIGSFFLKIHLPQMIYSSRVDENSSVSANHHPQRFLECIPNKVQNKMDSLMVLTRPTGALNYFCLIRA
jgi:NifB/MoaA-like Fe-S oxidoreductase